MTCVECEIESGATAGFMFVRDRGLLMCWLCFNAMLAVDFEWKRLARVAAEAPGPWTARWAIAECTARA